jgi:hypothetical protein
MQFTMQIALSPLMRGTAWRAASRGWLIGNRASLSSADMAPTAEKHSGPRRADYFRDKIAPFHFCPLRFVGGRNLGCARTSSVCAASQRSSNVNPLQNVRTGFIDSFGVVFGLHLEIPREWRPESIREADVDQIHVLSISPAGFSAL